VHAKKETHMLSSVFFEVEFILLVLFSIVIPVALYTFLIKKKSISVWTVLCFGLLLLVISGIDVTLLKMLAELAKKTTSEFDDKLFLSELSITLYLLPALFAGVGINLISHVLINHLTQAETNFKKARSS